MENQTATETLRNGHTLEDLSDLSGIAADVLEIRFATPREFTLGEVAELAPHLGMTAGQFVGSVL